MMKTEDKNILTALTVSMLLIPSSWAELRTWTDNYGHKIQAELVENRNGEVTLHTDKGKSVHISISDLSSTDQKYVLKNSPPKMEISVSEVTDRQNKGFTVEDSSDSSNDRDVQIQTSHSHYKATISKSSSIEYAGKIYAELYVFGQKKASEDFVVMSKTVKPVTFNPENDDNSFIITSPVSTTRAVQGGLDVGTEYFGNLVVLVDEKGRVFQSKGSRSKMAEYIGFIRKLKAGDVVSKAQLASVQNNPGQ